jgi:hypothetical protein
MTGLPKLSHFSKEVLNELRSADVQLPRYPEIGWSFSDKPQGLWVSVDGEADWKEWCISTGYNLPGLAIRYRVALKEPKRLLWLMMREQVLEFQEQYGVASPFSGISGSPGIDWSRVAETYAGIVIAPYQWSLRLNLMWYYCWDCASGCIWDTSVIEKVTRLRGRAKSLLRNS